MNKGLEYIKSKIPFSAGFYEGDMEDVVIKGLDIAIKEVIDDRHRVESINLECARNAAKKEVFDDIEENLDYYTTVFIKEKFVDIKNKHLNTKNTEK